MTKMKLHKIGKRGSWKLIYKTSALCILLSEEAFQVIFLTKHKSENHSEGWQNVYPSNTMYSKNKVYTELATWANLYCREVL